MEKQFRALPDEYRFEVEKEKQGTIERLQYNVPNLDNGKNIKYLNVYLPYCYDTADKNTKYNVLYLMHGGGEDENLIFGGFSMGAVTTWYTYINCLDYFKYFMPLSGDCWVFGPKAGCSKAKETAEYLANIPKLHDYTPKDYYIFCATGSLDIAYPNMYPQIYAMKEMKDSFIYSPDINEGNFYFIVCEGADHTWHWVNQYIYNILPDLFKDTDN